MMLAATPYQRPVHIMQISYSLSEKDFVDAGLLMQRKRGRAGQILQWIGGLTVFAFVCNLVLNPTSRASLLSVDSLPKVALANGRTCTARLFAAAYQKGIKASVPTEPKSR